jgi:thiol-disulfide isomerase/thioredoxin
MKLFQKFIPFLLWVVPFLYGFTKASAQGFTPVYFKRDSIASFPLLSAKGKKLAYKNTTELSCFIFLSPECPLCKNYAALINTLKKKYDNSVTFYLLVPGKSYSKGEIKRFSRTYLKGMAIYRDATFDLSRYLRATITPEVVLIESRSGQAVYRGALDNWAVSLGRQRTQATTHFLQDAIESYLRHQPPPVAFSEPVGCLINDF